MSAADTGEVSGAGPAESTEAGPDARAVFGGLLRVVLVTAGLITAVATMPHQFVLLIGCGVYLLISVFGLWLIVMRRDSMARKVVFMITDVGVVTAASYGTDITRSAIVMFYVAVLLGYSLYGRQLGRAALAVCLVQYTAVLALELTGVLPHAPLLPAEHTIPITPAYAGASLLVVTLGVLSAYGILHRTIDLLERHRDTREKLLVAEREAREARLKQQVAEVQRVEALGRLAGGIAHDFNNLLTTLMGYAGLLRKQLPADSELQKDLEEIINAAKRGGNLTAQLLAFSRRQPVRPQRLDVNELVAGLQGMLTRVIGEDIRLEVRRSPEKAVVKADPGQLEQTIVNLVVNARDAMPDGGVLTIETSTPVLSEEDCAALGGLAPGEFVKLTVRDTGVGMEHEVAERVFEPFFTTKHEGKGTGLGLATAYGIVRQSRGQIEVRSTPGEGTAFDIYLPRRRRTESGSTAKAILSEKGQGETILVAEDERAVLELATRLLEGNGYRVLSASDGPKALELAEAGDRTIDLLLTDIVMPGMSGHELADRLKAARPELRIMYMSGYDPETMSARGSDAPKAPLLAKPFADFELLNAVRKVLDGSSEL